MARAAADRYPAMAASAALHATVLILALISWPWSKTIRIGDVVTVNLVTSADLPAAAPAVQAPEPAPAATENPVAQAPPQAPAPVETPTPAPAVAKTPPTPVAHQAAPAKAAPAPAAHPTQAARPAPKAAPELDRAALLASLTRQTPVSGPRQSSAARGATRPDQAVQARTSSGVSDAASGAALASLSGELQRLWNPICSAPGAADVTIKVTFRIGSSGRLIGSPQSSQAGATDNVVRVASDRAVRPIYEADPFADPAYAVLYGQNITVNFDQKSFCSNR